MLKDLKIVDALEYQFTEFKHCYHNITVLKTLRDGYYFYLTVMFSLQTSDVNKELFS